MDYYVEREDGYGIWEPCHSRQAAIRLAERLKAESDERGDPQNFYVLLLNGEAVYQTEPDVRKRAVNLTITRMLP